MSPLSKPAPFFIAIAGGTASGKTTLARQLAEHFGATRLQVIEVDSYYRNQDHLPMAERQFVNYDHPDAFEFELLTAQLKRLQTGQAVEMPLYDFSLHTRASQVRVVGPTRIVIIEGILSLYPAELRELYAATIFVDTPEELRLARRITRDVAERGRTEEMVRQQWSTSVQSSFQQYCLPCKDAAMLTIDGRMPMEIGVAQAAAFIRAVVK